MARRATLLGAVALGALAGCGGSGPSPAEVARAAGATSCDNSGFYIQNRLSNTKDVIFDCRFAGSLPKCVTYSGNIADDASEQASLLFSTSVGHQGKPRCLAERRAAIARQRAARERRYTQALVASEHERWHRGFETYWKGITGHALPNVYYRWLPLNSYSCSAYVSSCWKLEIITRHGCPGSLSIEVEEFRGSTQIGTAYGDGGSVEPRIHEVVEVDTTDTGSFTGDVGTITCF
jgi:hypothetical protein